MSYLLYLCLSSYNGVQHILCRVFVLFFLVFCPLCYQFLLIVLFVINMVLLFNSGEPI